MIRAVTTAKTTVCANGFPIALTMFLYSEIGITLETTVPLY